MAEDCSLSVPVRHSPVLAACPLAQGLPAVVRSDRVRLEASLGVRVRSRLEASRGVRVRSRLEEVFHHRLAASMDLGQRDWVPWDQCLSDPSDSEPRLRLALCSGIPPSYQKMPTSLGLPLPVLDSVDFSQLPGLRSAKPVPLGSWLSTVSWSKRSSLTQDKACGSGPGRGRMRGVGIRT